MAVGGKDSTDQMNPQYLVIYDKNQMEIKAKWSFCNFLMTFKNNKCVNNEKDNIYLAGP